MFSTIYTLAFYWYQAENTSMTVVGLDDMTGGLVKDPEAGDSFITIVVDNMLEFILESLSWFSPFILVKGLLLVLVPTPIYEPLNLLILRPLGWIGTWITTEWVINKIRGGSET
jgi:hypothetical protein